MKYYSKKEIEEGIENKETIVINDNITLEQFAKISKRTAKKKDANKSITIEGMFEEIIAQKDRF